MYGGDLYQTGQTHVGGVCQHVIHDLPSDLEVGRSRLCVLRHLYWG